MSIPHRQVPFSLTGQGSVVAPLRATNGKAPFCIAIGGDLCLGETGTALARNRRAREILAPVKGFLDDANLRLVQFAPLPRMKAPIAKSGPNLYSGPDCVAIVKGVFDVALLANNHTGDHGGGGVLDRVRELRARELETVGAGRNLAEATQPLRLTRDGRTVSIRNFVRARIRHRDGAPARRRALLARAGAGPLAAGARRPKKP